MQYRIKTFGANGEEREMLLVQVIGFDAKTNAPILDVPMMTDEFWTELCRRSTMQHYAETVGREAPDYETARAWERKYFGWDALSEKESFEVV